MLLENVAALLSEKCRDCMDYLQQAIHVWSKQSWNQTLLHGQAAADRGLRITYCCVNGHAIGAPVGHLVAVACWKQQVWVLSKHFG